MKKVTIIFPGWIKAPNGAAQFVFGLRSCINDFANQGIGLSTFTLDDVHGEVRNFSNNDKIKRKASLKNKMKYPMMNCRILFISKTCLLVITI